MKRGDRVWPVAILTGALAACVACSPNVGDVPTVPVTSAAAADEGGRVSAHARPNAVFRTVPVADAAGTIRGSSPLLVQFNNCQSRPGEEDDDLKFTYDFDGDGSVDAFGHCRWDYTYTEPASARVCVSDRRTASTSGVPFQCPAPALTFTVTDPAWTSGAPCMAGPPNSCLFPPNNWNPIDVSTTMTF